MSERREKGQFGEHKRARKNKTAQAREREKRKKVNRVDVSAAPTFCGGFGEKENSLI